MSCCQADLEFKYLGFFCSLCGLIGMAVNLFHYDLKKGMLAKFWNSISHLCCHDRVSEERERVIAWICAFMWLASWGASS